MDIKKTVRMEAKIRKESLLEAGILLAEKHGIKNISVTQVAKEAGLRSHSLVYHYFFSMAEFRDQLATLAMESDNAEIALQLLVSKNPCCKKMKPELRQKALDKLASE